MPKNELPFDFFLATQRRRIAKMLKEQAELRQRKFERLNGAAQEVEMFVTIKGTYGGVSQAEVPKS